MAITTYERIHQATPVDAGDTWHDYGVLIDKVGATSALYATLSDVQHGVYDVKAYGAAGDGITDDTAAIQSAIDAAYASGNEVVIPAGTYLISDALSLTWGENIRRPISIRGAGGHDNYSSVTANTSLTIIRQTSTTADAFAFTALSGAQPHISLSNMQIWGPGKASGSGNGVKIDNASGAGTSYTMIHDVAIIGFGGANGLHLDNVYGGNFVNVAIAQCDIGLYIDNNSNTNLFNTVHLTDNVTYGLKITGGSGSIQFNNIVAQGNDGTAIYLENTSNNLWNNGYTENNGILALHLAGDTAKYVIHQTFVNWTFNSSTTTDRVKLSGVSGGTVGPVAFVNCKSYVAHAEAFHVADVYVGNITLIESFASAYMTIANGTDVFRQSGRYLTAHSTNGYLGFSNSSTGGGEWRIGYDGAGGSYAGGLYVRDITTNVVPLAIAASPLADAVYIGAGGVQFGANGNATKLLRHGTAILTGGSVTVNNTDVTANSQFWLTSVVDGGTHGWLRVSARVAGASFTITSSSGTDTSTVSWLMIEP